VPLSHSLLRGLLRRKGRREHGLFLLEGHTLLEEAVTSGLEIVEVRATREAAAVMGAQLETAAQRGAAVIEDSKRNLERLSDVESSPGIIAVARMGTRPLWDVLDRPGLVLLLAGVSDPGNAGTLVRTAEAFGASGVIFGEGGVEPYNPKVVRGAMGSLFRLPHAVANAGELLAGAAQAERAVVAADRGGAPLRTFTFPPKPILAIGGERGGVAAWLPSWEAAVAVPHTGPTESLNAAVAGAIVLYEWSFGARFSAQN